MLIAYQSLNKMADPRNARFSDAVLIITPGITIRDRLRVLLPNDLENYYRQRDILPPHLLEHLGQARIVSINFHAFRRLKKISRPLTKTVLANGACPALNTSRNPMAKRMMTTSGEWTNRGEKRP